MRRVTTLPARHVMAADVNVHERRDLGRDSRLCHQRVDAAACGQARVDMLKRKGMRGMAQGQRAAGLRI
jgi:hypothetical protein